MPCLLWERLLKPWFRTKKVSRDFLKIFRILPEAFITPPRFCANSADISLPVGTLMRTLSRLEGSVSQHQSSRISLPRERLPRSLFPDRETFFPNKDDHPYSPSCLEQNFLRFWYAAFPEKKDSGVSTRAYDFRHHFVYANMNRWLREGKDVNAMLPYLMRYMGHSDIKNTLYYYGKQVLMESA